MKAFNRSRLVVAVLCAVLCVITAAPVFAGTVVVRRGPLGVRQRVVVRQPQSVIVGPRNAAAIIAPQGVIVPQSVIVPSQQVIVGPQPAAIIIR